MTCSRTCCHCWLIVGKHSFKLGHLANYHVDVVWIFLVVRLGSYFIAQAVYNVYSEFGEQSDVANKRHFRLKLPDRAFFI